MDNLIDRKVLLREMEELYNKRAVESTMTGNRACHVTWNDAVYLVTIAPTVEAEPKHGRWSEKHYCSNLTGYDYAVICSECEKPTYRQFAEPTPNYCPNCGADMREVEE